MLNIKKYPHYVSPFYIYIYIHIPKLMLMVLIHILTTCRSFEGWIQSWTAWNLTRRARTSADAPIIGESLASSMWMDPFGSKKGGMDPGMKNLDLFLCWAFASKCKTGHRISLKQSCIAMVYWQKWWRAHRNSGTHLISMGNVCFWNTKIRIDQLNHISIWNPWV